MSEWKEYCFSDAIEICPTVSLKGTDSYSFVEMKDLSDDNRYCHPSIERKLSGGSRFQDRDTLFARITPCLENGKICQVTGLKNGVGFGSTEFLVFRGKKDITDNAFVFYLSRSEEVRSFAEQNFDGTSGRQRVPKSTFDNLPIVIPPLHEQRAIAGVLSSLDDKIDLLHRQNKTLEGIAGALWRKMFVEEADPGWRKGKLGDLVELCYGKGLKEEKRIPGKYPVVGSSGIVGYHNDFIVNGPGIVIGRKGTLGVVNYIEENFFPIDTTYFIKSKTNSGRLFFEYFLLKEFSFEEMNSDSAVPGLNREIAESMEFLVPEIESIYKFNDSCEPLFTKKMKNENQIRTLSSLRDTLLPKLMSGEVRVKI